MADEGIICNSCGKLTSRDNAYCTFCGAYLDAEKEVSPQIKQPLSNTPDSSPPNLVSNLTPPTTPDYASKAFSGKTRSITGRKIAVNIVAFCVGLLLINVLISYLLLAIFSLPQYAYGAMFVGTLLLSLILTGIIFLVIKSNVMHTGGAAAGFAGFGVVLAFIIGIPVYTFNALVPILSSFANVFGDWIGSVAETIVQGVVNAIAESISQFFSSLTSQIFENVEVPGFEPVVFLGVLAVFSIYFINSYHKRVKKSKI